MSRIVPPEEICHLFQRRMGEGDLDALLALYDPQAVFLNQSAQLARGRDELRAELAPLAAAKTRFEFDIR